MNTIAAAQRIVIALKRTADRGVALGRLRKLMIPRMPV
jgi:hypothetical protein